MQMKTRLLLLTLLLALFSGLRAQELMCKVTVNAQKVTSADPKIFRTLETALNEFMNGRKWTGENFKTEERIECSMFLTIQQGEGNQYTASLAIQSSRPVFNSNYSSTMINFIDPDVQFEYQEFQPIEFSDNTYISNLTSILAFWAYYIIGLDYDSFSKRGGQRYFSLAEQVMNTVPQNTGYKGWRPFDGQQNRYWIITNMLNARFDPLRDAWYDYHLKGLDQMYDKLEDGRNTVYNSVKTIGDLADENKNNVTIQNVSRAKSDEIIGIFELAEAKQKAEVVGFLTSMDPTKASVFEKQLGK